MYLNVPPAPGAAEPAPPAFFVPLASAESGTSFSLPPVYVLPQLLVSAVKVKMETFNTYQDFIQDFELQDGSRMMIACVSVRGY